MIVRTSLVFVVSRLVLYGLIFLAPEGQFDTSTELTLNRLVADGSKDYWNRHLWNKLLSWDAVFFIKGMTSEDGIPEFEHEYAFSPLWIRFVRLCAGNNELYDVLKVGVLLENVLFFLSSIVLYYLTRRLFSQSNRESFYAKRLAGISTDLFIFTSASGFLTGIYSEPLSFALAFSGMLCRELSVEVTIPSGLDCMWSKWPLYILSSMCFSFATLNRPNCVLLGIYYIFDLLQLAKDKKVLKAVAFPLLAGVFLFICCVYQHYILPFDTFCPQRGGWCETQLSASLPFTSVNFYNHIQDHYWNVGFLKYWAINNIPNFLLAMPNIVVLLYSTIYFSKIYPHYRLKPLIIITQALLIMLIFFAHVQIINRVSSFIPLHLWYMADRILKTSYKQDDTRPIGDDKIVKAYIYWLALWIPLQTVLFACFLPPA